MLKVSSSNTQVRVAQVTVCVRWWTTCCRLEKSMLGFLFYVVFNFFCERVTRIFWRGRGKNVKTGVTQILNKVEWSLALARVSSGKSERLFKGNSARDC